MKCARLLRSSLLAGLRTRSGLATIAFPLLTAAYCAIYAGLMLSGCTVTPARVEATRASFDAGTENSGFLGFDSAGNGILTPHANNRYDALVRLFSARFHPPLQPGEGIKATATNTFLIDPEHLVKFGLMAGWLRGTNGAPDITP